MNIQMKFIPSFLFAAYYLNVFMNLLMKKAGRGMQVISPQSKFNFSQTAYLRRTRPFIIRPIQQLGWNSTNWERWSLQNTPFKFNPINTDFGTMRLWGDRYFCSFHRPDRLNLKAGLNSGPEKYSSIGAITKLHINQHHEQIHLLSIETVVRYNATH